MPAAGVKKAVGCQLVVGCEPAVGCEPVVGCEPMCSPAYLTRTGIMVTWVFVYSMGLVCFDNRPKDSEWCRLFNG